MVSSIFPSSKSFIDATIELVPRSAQETYFTFWFYTLFSLAFISSIPVLIQSLGKNVSFYVGVLMFAAARAIMILHSIFETHASLL
jgi:hypothetical protein